MLRVEQLEVRRGQGVVLSGIDLQLHPGEVLGVLGPNGAGKSTLLAAMTGELSASAGRVTLDQRALDDWAGPERARRLAVLPQTSSLNFAFRVEEVVAMGRLQDGTFIADEVLAKHDENYIPKEVADKMGAAHTKHDVPVPAVETR